VSGLAEGFYVVSVPACSNFRIGKKQGSGSGRSWVLDRAYADFLELRTREVRRMWLLGTPANKPVGYRSPSAAANLTKTNSLD
jgi:hypothetical protein